MRINILEAIYPVGSIYMNTNDTSPAQIVGGSWEPVESKYLRGLAAGEESTGGGTFGIENLPVDMGHLYIRGYGSQGTGEVVISTTGSFSNGFVKDAQVVAWAGSHIMLSGGIQSKCSYQDIDFGGEGEEYLPSYFGVYIWRRIA